MALKPVVTQSSANFTRAANTTEYSAGDLVANSVTSGSVAAMQFTISVGNGRALKIVSVKLETDNTVATDASFRLHLYAADPTASNGDNGVWLTTESTHIGFIDLDECLAFASEISSTTTVGDDKRIYWRLASGQILYGLLEARASYTPASAEVYTVTLNIEHNQ